MEVHIMKSTLELLTSLVAVSLNYIEPFWYEKPFSIKKLLVTKYRYWQREL